MNSQHAKPIKVVRRYAFFHYPSTSTTVWKDEIAKGRVLYVSGKKPWTHHNGCRGELVWVLYLKYGGATDGIQNIILMMRMEDKFTLMKLNTWASRTVSGCLEARVGGKQYHIWTLSPIRDRVFWQEKRTVLHLVFFLVVGKCETWVIAPYVISPALYVSVVVLATI